MASQHHEQHFGNSTVQARAALDRLATSADITAKQRDSLAQRAATAFPVQVQIHCNSFMEATFK